MSLPRNFLSRRITDRSFLFSSRSVKEFRNAEIDGKNRKFVNDDVRRVHKSNDDAEQDDAAGVEGKMASSPWSDMLPELLEEIIQRVEASDETWPHRQNIVACGCVCKQWRVVTKEVVKAASSRSGSAAKITFPSCLKKPGPRDPPIQCLITRDKKNAIFYLYLALSPSFTEKGKFLLAAKRFRNGTHTEYIISLDADDFSQGSNAYVGKLRATFFGTNFTIYDSQPPYNGAKPSSSRASRRFASKQISPQVPASNFKVGSVSYDFNLLKSRGPRMMECALKSPWSSEPDISLKDDLKMKALHSAVDYSVLINKVPRWHENLQCWCLNFHGRVTVASVKNFQLIATVDQSQPGAKGDDEIVLLQFGKVADDIFTMDFRKPLSAFQAFAVCLTSFGTKLGCE